MDVTENFQLPYPQCSSPLVKDASDINDLRDLAEAVDAVVGEFAQAIDDLVVSPDACRMSIATPVVSSLTDNVMFFDAASFDNTPGSAMTDLVNGAIEIQTDGWYMVGSWIVSSVATDVQNRTRYIVNGTPVTNFQGPGGLAQPGQQNCSAIETVFLLAGDLLTVATRNGSPGTSVSYTGVVWCVLVGPNV